MASHETQLWSISACQKPNQVSHFQINIDTVPQQLFSFKSLKPEDSRGARTRGKEQGQPNNGHTFISLGFHCGYTELFSLLMCSRALRDLFKCHGYNKNLYTMGSSQSPCEVTLSRSGFQKNTVGVFLHLAMQRRKAGQHGQAAAGDSRCALRQ